MNNWIIKIAAANALGMIGIGAAGGHKHTWSQERKNRFMKSQIYHLLGTAGLFVAGAISFRFQPFIAIALLLGNMLFCAPLYYLTFTEDIAYNKMMPVGGIMMMAGFGLMLI